MSQRNESGTQRTARRLTPEQRRRILEMRRRQRRKKQLIIAGSAALALVIAVAVGLSFAPGGKKGDDKADSQGNPVAAEAMSLAAIDPSAQDGAGEGDSALTTLENPAAPADASGDPGASAEPGASAAPAATENPNKYVPTGGKFVYDEAYAAAARGAETGPLIEPDLSAVDPAKLNRWPKVTEGYMPILYHANNVSENIIAITVDDCFQANNLRQIVQCALDNNGKLTIFPIGSNIAKQNIGDAVKWAWESGMEIENHTYNHAGMYHYDDERMAKEMWMQSQMLNQVLGVNYQEHFFRPKGGDEREDQRVHAYANQMGMAGIAIWSQSGSRSSVSNLLENLAPGRIYLFHTTDNDLQKLLQFIPEVTNRGYRLVTLNEMFGLPENATSALTQMSDPPALEAFQIKPALLRKTTYVRAAAVVQKRLIELGWLEAEADGVFGESSFMATGYFQLAADLKADGKAGAETQMAMFAEDAPSATSENKAKVQSLMKK